ncbi:MAG: hypothetical protein SCALA702_34400 [Melioribacteraceae bacterium]|nr:MAG: hypothetical protein SCALA702_34400 [Melioribacteraceae bacterium]
MTNIHTFHIPVLGISFTIDTPLKVSQFGIDSVISLADDILLEKLRKFLCINNNILYEEITTQIKDFRAERITSYLNLVNNLASKQFEEFKKEALQKKERIKEYLDMLPHRSDIAQKFNNLIEKSPTSAELSKWMDKHLSRGSIDVNIMTKIDKETYNKNEKLPSEYNYAHSALRGYANSDLTSSVVFSAGINPGLYGYITQFKDFHPDENGEIKKKIIIKVSDYRSALIQGKFLAKKGIWVSEYRIESGLNCGGHAFATDGFLLGPILAEFRDKRQELFQEIHDIYIKSLSEKDQPQPNEILPIRISAQGGVGTALEHQFLREYYKVDSVGWGSPFLLVPEATTVDDATLIKLAGAREKDLYLGNVSPLGVQFNNLKNSTMEEEKNARIKEGKPGSPCVKRFLAFNREFSEKGLCTASRKYQVLKIKELNEQELSPPDYQKKYDAIVDKECLCAGLGTSSLIVKNMDANLEGYAVSVCPGPNIAYFTKIMSLKEITDHIYGRANMITGKDRPNLFMKELQIYVEYLKNKVDECKNSLSDNNIQYLEKFVKNLNTGISYYRKLFGDLDNRFKRLNFNALKTLKDHQQSLNLLNAEIQNLAIIKNKRH